MKKKQLLHVFLFVLVVGLLVVSCGKRNPSHPLFGDLLNDYEKAVSDEVPYKEIEPLLSEVAEKAKKEGHLPVSGNPYGISCSKAVVLEYNVQWNCINIILEFIPDEGTDFHLQKHIGPYGKLVYCRMMAGDKLIKKDAAWYTHNKMKATLTIYNNEVDIWRGLDRIELIEKRK